MRNKLSLLLVICFAFSFFGRADADEISYIKSTDTYKRIKDSIDKIRIVDAHEHLRPEAERLKKPAPDFFKIFLSSYVRTDIKNVGKTFSHDERFFDESLSVEQRWESFKPVYEHIKNTGYVRCVRLGMEKVHGIRVADAESIKKINKSLKKLYKSGVYQKVLRDIGNIEYILTCGKFPEGIASLNYADYFKPVRAFDQMVVFTSAEDIYNFERQYGIMVHSLDDIEKIYRKYVDRSIAEGAVGFKCTGAYLRSLDFSECSREKAEVLLKRLVQLTEPKWSWIGGQAFSIEDGQNLSNYCMHTMLKIIEEKGYPLAVHTGLQNKGKNEIRNSNPQLLIPLFKEYKNINFDIFHGGWPYLTGFVEVGKSWPNVYLNQCWLDIISPESARRQLSEMLECVPVHKILAFGGDCQWPEQVIGHLEITKENCAVVLAEKVLVGRLGEAKAIEYAERIFRTNAVELYKLEKVDRKE